MRTTTIPSYPYTQYADDDNIRAFFDAYNAITTQYVQYLAALYLPVYSSPTIAGPLLDWVGTGLYGLPRPVIPLGALRSIGPYNTWDFNSIALNAQRKVGNVTFLNASDDIYRRYLTWHLYLADGRQFTIPWLKRRIARFLRGSNGADILPPTTLEVSVQVARGVYSITINPSMAETLPAQIFQAMVRAGLLQLPFQYSYQVAV